MQVKVYVPKTVEIPSEYLPALVQRANENQGEAGHSVAASRGHLVRQAVRDGLLRELDHLMSEDDAVDLYCDPGSEIPLEIENRTVTLSELLEALQNKKASWGIKSEDLADKQPGITPRRRAA